MNKKYAAFFTASALLLTSLSAAENFPTSQFDHDGWYRPSGTVCPAQDAVATPSNRHTCQCAVENACTFHGG